MTAVVVGVAALLVVISFFAVGLLHSYAGLLRRVQELEDGALVPGGGLTGPLNVPGRSVEAEGGLRGIAAQDARLAADVSGVSLTGETVTIAVGDVRHRTLLAFLSSGCSTCARFWAALPLSVLPGGEGTRLVVVTQGPADESVAALRTLAPPGAVDVVMSSDSWREYQIPGSPYFVLVDGPSGLVRGEGTAAGWEQVFDLMALAEGDAGLAVGMARQASKPASDAAREAEVDRILLRAGIRPGDPSLYPGQAGRASATWTAEAKGDGGKVDR